MGKRPGITAFSWIVRCRSWTATRPHGRSAPGKAVDPAFPWFALTADAMNGAQEQCLKAGMDDYLTKPLDRECTPSPKSIDRHLARLKAGTHDPGPRNAGEDTRAGGWRCAGRRAGQRTRSSWEAFISLTDGDDDFAGQLVQLFIDSGDASLSEIRDALGRGDLPAVADAPRMRCERDRAPDVRARPGKRGRSLPGRGGSRRRDGSSCNARRGACQQEAGRVKRVRSARAGRSRNAGRPGAPGSLGTPCSGPPCSGRRVEFLAAHGRQGCWWQRRWRWPRASSSVAASRGR